MSTSRPMTGQPVQAPERPAWLAQRDAVAAIVTIVLVGGVLRIQQAVVGGFPLGDGGLFYATIEQVRAAGGLPPTIFYNGEVPLVYPPLGFIVAAAAASLTGVGTEAALRILPPLLSIGTLLVIPWSASRFLNSRPAGLLAGALLAVTPQTYDQLVAGGGVTRALGMLLALVAVGAAAGSHPTRPRGIVVGILLGLAALAHPRVAIFALGSVAFVWWRDRARVSRSEILVALGVAALCVLPWLALVVARDQFDALTSAGQRLDVVVGAVSLLVYPGMQLMHGGLPNIAAVLAISGVTASLFMRRWDILVWLVMVHLLNCPPFISAVAWSIAGAAGLWDLGSLLWKPTWSARAAIMPVAVLTFLALLSATASPADPGSKQQPMLPAQVEAARELAELPETARVAVVTSETWGNDLFGEWLPVLSARTVVTTPQGSEWLGAETFGERVEAHRTGQRCSRETSECVANAITNSELDATHIVVPRGSVAGPRAPDDCCPALLETIYADGRFEIVIDSPGALVAAWDP